MATKFAVGFLLTKLFALFLGPTGLAMLGNLKNFTQLLSSYGVLGMQNGIIRFTAEWKQNPKKITSLIGTLNSIFIISSLSGGLLIYFFSETLALHILNDISYQFLFKVVAVIFPMHSFHMMYYSVFQGIGNYKRIVGQDIAMNLIKIVIASILVFYFDLIGALLAIVVVPAFYLILSIWNISKTFEILKLTWSKIVAKNLAIYTLMSLFSSIAIPVVYIIIRNKITATLGSNQAGYWEAVNQFSFFYFMALQSLMLMYVLPKIASNQDVSFFKKQLRDYFVKLFPLFLVFLIILFLLRDFAIRILFTEEFLPVRDLMFWQFMGDVFRAFSLVLVAYIHARRLIKYYVLIDLILSLSLLYFTFRFIDQFGLVGVVRAHFLSYVIYFVSIIFLMRKVLFKHKHD